MKHLLNRKFKKDSKVVLGFFSALNILLNFVNQWYLVTEIGPGKETDAYYAALVVPSLFILVTAGSIDKVIVPILVSKKKNFSVYSWTYLSLALIIFSLLSLLLSLSSFLWVHILFPGFGEDTAEHVVQLINILSINMVLHALAAVLWSINYARKQFLKVEYVEIFSTIIAIAFLFYFLPKYGIIIAAWSLVIKMILQVIFLSPALGRYQGINYKDEVIKESISKLKPLIFGSIYYKSDEVVNRFLASMANPGSITILYLAMKLYKAGINVFGKTIINPAVTKLSVYFSEGRLNKIKKFIAEELRLIAILSITIYLAVIIFGHYIFQILFEYRNFSSEKVEILWFLMVLLGGMWIGRTLSAIFTSTFYSVGDTKSPTIIGVIVYTIGIILRFILFDLLNIEGIAFAISIQALLSCIILFIFVKKKYL